MEKKLFLAGVLVSLIGIVDFFVFFTDYGNGHICIFLFFVFSGIHVLYNIVFVYNRGYIRGRRSMVDNRIPVFDGIEVVSYQVMT